MQTTFRFLAHSVILFLGTSICTANVFGQSGLEGRWDLTLSGNNREYPSWLEVTHSGNHTLVGRFTGIVGSARPISEIKYADGKFSFTIPPQWEGGENNFVIEGTLDNDRLSGTINTSDNKTFPFTGVRAPALRPEKEPQWGKPVRLFDGKTLNGWHALGKNQWLAENGILRSPASGANLVTDQKFTDFKLHIEFRYPKGSNSGVYLRGRYEVQITDSKGMEPSFGELGAVYGFLTPSENPALEAGTWQSYDITLTGRMITIVANGKKIICNQAIPGITGGALDSHEGEPGPLLIQGDHGPIEYRNIILTPAIQ